MSDNLYRTQLRFPADLADKLKEIAEENGQSFNKEVVDRLTESLSKPRDPLKPITAEEAKKLAEQGAINTRNNLFRDCMAEIAREAAIGSQEAWVAADMDCASEDVLNKVLYPVMRQLKDLGYKCEYIDDSIAIKF